MENLNSKLVKVFGFDFVNNDLQEMVMVVKNRMNKELKTFIVTGNPEILMYARKNKDYKNKIQAADFLIPDGYGIILASKIFRTPIRARLTGFDLMIELLKLANDENKSIYLLGGSEKINSLASQKILSQFPNITLAGRHHGFFDWNNNNILLEVKQKKPDIVFVAMGYPRQEKWISEYSPLCEKGIFIGVGGSVDVIAGALKRAPIILQRLNLEWLYRVIQEPKRWKRIIVLPKFIFEILKLKLKKPSIFRSDE